MLFLTKIKTRRINMMILIKKNARKKKPKLVFFLGLFVT